MTARRTSSLLLALGMIAGPPPGIAWAGTKTRGNRTAQEARKAAPAGEPRKAPANRPARRTGGKIKGKAGGKAPSPRPDPLAGAWPDARRPQLGNGRPDSEIVVAALRLRGMRQSWDENRFLRHLAYVMDWARKSDLPDDAWTRTLLHRASGRGSIRRDRSARPGDLALFALAGSTRKPSRVLAAVVVSAGDQALEMVGPIGGGIQELRMGKVGKAPGDTALRTCPPPGSPRDGGAGKNRTGKSAKGRKAPRPPAPDPCRTGDLYLGRVPWESLPALW